uniref:DUF4283 domain-containing protein n=2 Tax=Opuntia streptacantha TaxID=393608 RepID=A0A7C9ABN9_OPUST
MPPKRRKKPPDLHLTTPPPIPRRGFLLFNDHLSTRFLESVAVSPKICAGIAYFTAFVCRPCIESLVWMMYFNRIFVDPCVLNTVREVAVSTSVQCSAVIADRHGKLPLNCASSSCQTQVWVLPSSPISVTVLGCLYCGVTVICVFAWFDFCPGSAIYIHAHFLDLVLVCRWSLISDYSINMSSSPSSPSLHCGPTDNLSDDARKEGTQTVSKPRPEAPSPHASSPQVSSPLPVASYSEALILGMSHHVQPQETPSQGPGRESAVPPPPPASMSSLCLLGKPWGDPIPLAIIMSKTRKDWGFVRGQLDYLELGNGWILFRFSNLQDIALVWNGRPWHVSGLNLVLRRWEPFFDPYSATIHRIDQWVKITRLPLELWEEDSLKTLLQDVGQFIKVDDITLNRSKGKFARVCLNIDITKPLRGSLFLPIPNQPHPLEVPISYEGLHEVCTLCGSNAHDLEVCPETPKGPLEVIVEKFGTTSLHTENRSGAKAGSSSVALPEKWVTVSPKKRGRLYPSTRKKTFPKTAANPGPPSVKVVSASSPPVNTTELSPKDSGQGLLPIPSSTEEVLPCPDLAISLAPGADLEAAAVQPEPLVGAAGSSCNDISLASAPSALNHFAPLSPKQILPSSNSPCEGTDMEEEDIDMFLNLEPEDDAQLSSESTKKRKLELGEASSPSYSST